MKTKKKRLASGEIKQYYSCNPCNTARAKKYRETDRGKQATRRAVKRYEESHPERRKAWRDANGMGSRPCEVCGSLPADKHHPDVTKGTEVVWLCRLHHKKAHRVV